MNPFDYNHDDFQDDQDPLKREGEEIKQVLNRLVDKVHGISKEPVSNEDILQYLRAINFNFASLSRIMSTFIFKMVSLEEAYEKLAKKIDEFLESGALIEESLKDESDSSNGRKPI